MDDLIGLPQKGVHGMNFMELVKARYSVRSFDPRPVEKEQLDLVLQAGQLAPTAANRQPQRILVVASDEGMEKLKDCTPYTFDAPMVLLVCTDISLSWKRKYDGDDSGVVDAAIVATHMMMAAAELGLGSTWVGSFDPDALRTVFSIPETLIPVCLLPMGYPSAASQVPPSHFTRKDIFETVAYDSF